MDPRVKILVGTTKGVFVLEADGTRETWDLHGPFCDGWPINHVIGDAATGRVWAAGGGEWEGAGIWRSDDGGANWTLSLLSNGARDAWASANPDQAEAFGFRAEPPAPFTGKIDTIWSLGKAASTLYAGTKPAALYASDDDGATWTLVEGLTDHPSADSWQPGGAGLVLHTIVADPDRPQKLWVAISAAGMFATEDGGQTWERRNRRSNRTTGAWVEGDGTEVGHCVHNVVRAATANGGGDLLYQQNHHGVFRSRDGGRSWDEITDGLPSGFGFPITVDPHDPDTIRVLPLNGDVEGRYPPGAAAAVWMSADGGATWRAERAGLPQENCFFTVLRQAMATDRAKPAGTYFGTNSGSIFAGAAGDGTWREIARHLPTILSVETVTAS